MNKNTGSEKNTVDLLSIEQVNFVGDNIASLFDQELIRLQKKSSNATEKVIAFVVSLYFDSITTFFSVSVVESNASKMNEDAVIRDFLLDLSEKFSFSITNMDMDNGERLLNTVIESVSRVHMVQQPEYSFINQKVLESIQFDKSTLTLALENNFWLLTLYLLVLFFKQTMTFKEYFSR